MSDMVPNRRDLFTVHVGNLNSSVTEEELRILFTGTGIIQEIFIQTSLQNNRFTYAFVRYLTLEEATTACSQVHGAILHGSAISVTFSDSTNRRIDGSGGDTRNYSRYNDKSISRNPHPRKEGANYVATNKDETEIHNALKQSLSRLNQKNPLTEWMGMESETDVQSFMKDFKQVLVTMSKVPQSVGVDAKTFEKKQEMADLEKQIVDHHKSSIAVDEFLPFKVIDFDVSSDR